MENGTKALLIAAAVLIAIILVALGIRLIGSVEDTSNAAGDTENVIVDALEQASGNLKDIVEESSYDNLDNNSFMEKIKSDYSGQQSGRKVIKLLEIIKNRYGSLYDGGNNKNRLYITSDSAAYEGEFTFQNIEYGVKTNNKYTVVFSYRGDKNSYSIIVMPK